MSKYREQMFRLLMASKKDDPGIIMKLKEQHSKVIHSINIIGNGIEGQLVNLFFFISCYRSFYFIYSSNYYYS